MDIKQELLKVKCPYCGKNIRLTYHAEQCPKCGGEFAPEQVRKTFHDYESALANNKIYQAGERMNKSGKAIQSVGDSMQSAGGSMMRIGCTMTIFTIIIIILLALIL